MVNAPTLHVVPPNTDAWILEPLADSLSRCGQKGQVVVLKNVASSQIEQEVNTLRTRMEQQGMLFFVVDLSQCRDSSSDLFREALDNFVQELTKRGLLTDDIEQSLEDLALSQGYGIATDDLCIDARNIYADAWGSMWTRLSGVCPAVLLITHSRQSNDQERHVLEHLMRHFFSDPIAQIAPEMAAWDVAKGAVVVVDDCQPLSFDMEGVQHQVIELGPTTEDSVRNYLSSPQVVQKFMASTGGDVQQLEALIECFPDRVQHLWIYRYEQLEPADALLVDVLAVAQDNVDSQVLLRVVEELNGAQFFPGALKRLLDMGLIVREIASGSMLLRVESSELSGAVVDILGPERVARVHLALAQAEQCYADSPCAAFLARHYLGAGHHEQALFYSVHAARTLVNKRAFEQAREMLEKVLPLAIDSEFEREIREQLVKCYLSAGEHRRALAQCGYLKRLVSGVESLELSCKIAQILRPLGHAKSALRLYEEVLDNASKDECREHLLIEAQLGASEASYTLANYKQAIEFAEKVAARVSDIKSSGVLDTQRTDEAIIRARNVLGKVAIYKAQYSQAQTYFQENYHLASTWGWSKECARAQANLGVVALQQRDYITAEQNLSGALSLASTQDGLPRATCLVNMAIVHQRRGNLGQALNHYLESMRVAKQRGDDVTYSVSAYNLATVYQDLGAFSRAHVMLEHISSVNAQGRPQFVSRWIPILQGQVLLEEARFEDAVEALAPLVEDSSSANSVVYTSEAHLRLAQAYAALEQWTKVEQILHRFEQRETPEDEPQLGALMKLCGSALLLSKNDVNQAENVAQEACDALTKLGHHRDALHAQILIAHALKSQGRTKEAVTLLKTALGKVRQSAQHVPEEFVSDFYSAPVHQQLVTLMQQLNGEVPAEFQRSIRRTESNQQAVVTHTQTPEFRRWRRQFRHIVGEDPRLFQIFRFVQKVAKSDAPVLLYGESGTGKELIAEALHTHREEPEKPFVKINCAAFVDSLLQSELFGHEKGAFTGAVSQKIGRFERADGGTLFLDEIGDISPATQVALLRVLQEGEFERVGGSTTLRVNVRVVCATNKNLEEMVKRGEFRLDLYYRLKGVVIEVPALRDRRGDIPRLVKHFVARYTESDTDVKVSPQAMHYLSSYSWPGNVRELENFVKSVLLFVEDGVLDLEHLAQFHDFFAEGELESELEIDPALFEMEEHVYTEEETPEDSQECTPEMIEDPEDALVQQIVADGLSLTKLKKRLELECIKRALIETDGNITRAAELLQMKRPRLSQIINATPELVECKTKLVG